MAIIGDVRIKVNSAVLNNKAQTVSKSITNMANSFEQLERVVSRTSYYWIGEAGDMHRKMYMNQKGQIDEMIKRLKEHPADLAAIAQTYDTTEAMVRSVTVQLPGDAIS